MGETAGKYWQDPKDNNVLHLGSPPQESTADEKNKPESSPSSGNPFFELGKIWMLFGMSWF